MLELLDSADIPIFALLICQRQNLRECRTFPSLVSLVFPIVGFNDEYKGFGVFAHVAIFTFRFAFRPRLPSAEEELGSVGRICLHFVASSRDNPSRSGNTLVSTIPHVLRSRNISSATVLGITNFKSRLLGLF